MASELDALGLRWQDEGDVRRGVAASVVAQASEAASAEQTAVEAAWRRLEAAEAEHSALLNTSAAQRTPSFSQQLTTLEMEVRNAKAALQKCQKQAERGKQERTRAALAIEVQREREIAERRQREATERTLRLLEQHRVPSSTMFPLPQPQPTATPTPTIHGDGVVAALRRRPSSSSGSFLGSRLPSSSSSGGVTEAVKEYQGGDVLLSAHGVTLTAAERAAKSEKYCDDGDEAAFEARQGRERAAAREAYKVAIREAREAAKSEDPDSVFDELFADVQRGEDSDDDGIEGVERGSELVAPVPGLPEYRVSAAMYHQLLDYQQEGLQWLVGLHHRREGGILGDEMGLGKTVQVAALLHLLHESRQLMGPVLVVAPLTVLSQWIAELHKWAPRLRSCILHRSGTCESVERLVESIRDKPAVAVTTYSTMALKNEIIQKARFQYVILDEGHKISNPDSESTIGAKSFVTPHKLILTGSPIQNTLKELWSLFDFVRPGLLGSLHTFVAEFEHPINASRSPKATAVELAVATECAKLLKRHVEPYLLRRMKRDVNAMLPAKFERTIRCTLTDSQLQLYVDVLKSDDVQRLLSQGSMHRYYTGGLDARGRDRQGSLWTGPRQHAGSKGLSDGDRRAAFRILHTLRTICNHVDIHTLRRDDAAEGGSGTMMRFRSNVAVNYDGSGKLETLRQMLAYWRPKGHKVLIFSQTRMMLDIIENMCEQEKHRYMRMDGNTPSQDRGKLIDRFNSDSSIFAAILTTKVGGLGVNLTGADRVVIFDPDWNPVNDEQARERAWRIGQTREVVVYRMISSGTIEETILHRQLAKTFVTEKVLNDPTLQRSFTLQSFVEAFYLGTEYTQRVPPSARHVISTVGDIAALETDSELTRENDDVLNPLNAVPTADSNALLEHDRKVAVLSGAQRSAPSTAKLEFNETFQCEDDEVKIEGDRRTRSASFRVTDHTAPVKKEEHPQQPQGEAASSRRPQGGIGVLQTLVDGELPQSNLRLERGVRTLAAEQARSTLSRAIAPTPSSRGASGAVKREREP